MMRPYLLGILLKTFDTFERPSCDLMILRFTKHRNDLLEGIENFIALTLLLFNSDMFDDGFEVRCDFSIFLILNYFLLKYFLV